MGNITGPISHLRTFGCTMLHQGWWKRTAALIRATLLFFPPSLLFCAWSVPFHSPPQTAGLCQPLPTHSFWDNTPSLPSTGQTFTPGAGEQDREKLQKLNTDSDGLTLDQPSDLPWWFNCVSLFGFVPSRARSSQRKPRARQTPARKQ